MNNRVSPGASFLALFFVICFIFGAPLALAGVTAESIIFQPATYKEALHTLNFYERFPHMLTGPFSKEAPALAGSSAGTPQEQDRLKYLGSADYEAILAALFPPDWLRVQSDTVIDNLFAYLNFQTRELTLNIPIRDVKARLEGEQGAVIAQRIIRSWPPCSVQQLMEMAALGLTGQLEGLPVCQPPESLLLVVTPLVEEALKGLAGRLPDTLDLAGLFGITNHGPTMMTSDPLVATILALSGYQWYEGARWLMRLSPLVVFLLLALILLLAVRGGRSLFIWWGAAFVGGGVMTLGLVLLGSSMGLDLLQTALRPLFDALAAELYAFSVDVGRFVLVRYLQWVGFEGLVMLVSGLVLLVGSFFFPRRRSPLG